ncbi:MAG TPA: hypothetical protein VHT70_05065 [Candidatus Saccharimonadales bacterium]|jgi:uncharacterized membrane protein|nr:hypothetical protein [Candidatus Saccharimonadales bacterium]
MPALQEAFYIIGIVFMSLMMFLMIIGVIAVLVIKAKINAIHRKIEEKITMVTGIANTAGEVIGAAKKVLHRD